MHSTGHALVGKKNITITLSLPNELTKLRASLSTIRVYSLPNIIGRAPASREWYFFRPFTYYFLWGEDFISRKYPLARVLEPGYPLFYYSSWPALSHQKKVWWCAEQVYPWKEFRNYAILGDDAVIADSRVAAVYEHTLSRLGVRVSYQKSLISDTGCAEFAKRFRVRNLGLKPCVDKRPNSLTPSFRTGKSLDERP